MEEKNNLKNETDIDKKIKTRKIGRFTFGIVLILVGTIILLQTMTTIDTLRYIMMLSPVIFISLGLEVLILSKRNDIKYDFIGVILTFLTLGAGWIFAGINYGVNKLLYDEGIVNVLSDNIMQDTSTYYFEDLVTISNLSDEKIDLNIIQSENADEVIVYVKYNYKNEIKCDNIVEFLINKENYYNTMAQNIDYENNVLMFVDMNDKVKNIEVKVITNNKEKVKIEGEFNLVK